MFPNPGFGYTIKERLGAGHWKEAFRAYNPSHGKDVAIVFFRDIKENRTAIREGSKLLSLAALESPFSSYIAEFYGTNISPDGKVFFVEELISHPLDRICPIRSLPKFAKYARDLCRGIHLLHSIKLVHRDLKLDNCGLSFGDRVKIFDLGSVTSEMGEVKGTILTRAPELFVSPAKLTQKKPSKKVLDQSKATFMADIWALGATIYALRKGTYPFVLQDEIFARKKLNEQLLTDLSAASTLEEREKLQSKADLEKSKIDNQVRERVFKSNASSSLISQIELEFRGKAAGILKSMLSFDPSERRSALYYSEQWDSVLEDLTSSHQSSIAPQTNRLTSIHNFVLIPLRCDQNYTHPS